MTLCLGTSTLAELMGNESTGGDRLPGFGEPEGDRSEGRPGRSDWVERAAAGSWAMWPLSGQRWGDAQEADSRAWKLDVGLQRELPEGGQSSGSGGDTEYGAVERPGLRTRAEAAKAAAE